MKRAWPSDVVSVGGCSVCFCRFIAVQLLPYFIKIGFEFGCISPGQRRIIRQVECDRDDAGDPGRAPGEDDDPVRQADGLGEVVGDQEGGLAGSADDLADVVADGEPGLVVQGGEGLVEEQKLRLHEQGTDEGGPLAHAPGQLGRPGAGKLFQAILFEHGFCMPLRLRGEPAADLRAQQDIPPDAPPLE